MQFIIFQCRSSFATENGADFQPQFKGNNSFEWRLISLQKVSNSPTLENPENWDKFLPYVKHEHVETLPCLLPLVRHQDSASMPEFDTKCKSISLQNWTDYFGQSDWFLTVPFCVFLWLLIMLKIRFKYYSNTWYRLKEKNKWAW